MALAETAGFTRNIAFELAKYDQWTDENPSTQPRTTAAQQRRDYHFVFAPQLEERREAAMACQGRTLDEAVLQSMGEYLHAFEDAFSHGQNPFFMWTAAHTPDGVDLPENNPRVFLLMVRAKFHALVDLRRACAPANVDEEGVDREWRRIEARIVRWVDEENSAGVYSTAGARWQSLLRDLFGSNYTAFTDDARRQYQRWRTR